jgi:very-short-patch-repair endonuclease
MQEKREEHAVCAGKIRTDGVFLYQGVTKSDSPLLDDPNPAFEAAYAKWMAGHCQASRGERNRRLREEHGHAEKCFLANVWWPTFGHFEGLHPEYEVRDFKDGGRFLDYACLSVGMRMCIEIDGYGPHWREISRWRFADNLMRQNHLLIDGWRLLRFAYDESTKSLAAAGKCCSKRLEDGFICGFPIHVASEAR